MNRKNNKTIKIVVVLLFFLVGGLWYFMKTGVLTKEQEQRELISVLEAGAEETVTPMVSKENSEEPQEKKGELVVYVCGAVNEPGIYTLPENSRLYEALAMAGGFSAEADPAYHNLARSIADGERIYILSYEETKELTTVEQIDGENGEHTQQGNISLINLNTATAEQLTSLPGIGEAKASNILEYRKKVGKFTAIEEIMNVSGIGEAMFEKIKDKIMVK